MVLCRQIGEDTARFRWLAAFYRLSGMIAFHQGDLRKAEALFDQGLTSAREVGDWYQTSLLLCVLASSRTWQGNYDSAVMLFTESLSIARKNGEQFLTALVLSNQGHLFLFQRDEERASDSFVESLTLSRNLHDHIVSHDSLEGLAVLACVQGRYDHAALLLGATDALRRTMGRRLSVRREGYQERYVIAARAGLGDAAFATAWAQGQAMTLEQAVEYALRVTEAPHRTRKKPISPARRTRAGLLAPREREVAALISEGKTNKEIAANLSIAESTVAAHVNHILNKLGANSRTQIAAWAVAHGLDPSSPSTFASTNRQLTTPSKI
jgi:DNA-binding NarL/FixJ family response regulator